MVMEQALLSDVHLEAAICSLAATLPHDVRYQLRHVATSEGNVEMLLLGDEDDAGGDGRERWDGLSWRRYQKGGSM